MTIRVVIVTNALGPPTRGNGTTVQRWLGWLPDVDVEAVVVAPNGDLSLREPLPDIVHGYHAVHGGEAAVQVADRYGLPLVISIGGTDLLTLRSGEGDVERVRRVFERAGVVTGAVPSFAEVLGEIPFAAVPRGVYVPDTVPTAPSDMLKVLLPAGLRPVKDPLLAIEMADVLIERGVPMTLRILGPALDDAYAQQVHDAADERAHVSVGEVDREQMPAEYAAAHVVWNTSLHEGGSNAILEALAHGCEVYVRNAPGNYEVLRDLEAPGRLFVPRDWEDLESFHRWLLQESAEHRNERVDITRRWLHAHHDSLAEVKALRAAYERVLAR